MAILGNIIDKIFGRNPAQSPPKPASAPPGAELRPSGQPQPRPAETPGSTPAPGQVAAQSDVDVGVVLETMAGMKDDHGGNYQTSIVDLLKLLDLDSGLSARRELAEELGVHAGEHGSAEQNIALHRAVMDKLAENGGVVPDSLRQ
jgi:hypothetical protein